MKLVCLKITNHNLISFLSLDFSLAIFSTFANFLFYWCSFLIYAASDHQDKSTPSDGIYRPPKLVPVPYSDSSTKTGSYLTSSLKERAGKSRLVHDLRSQYDDRPDELDVGGTGYTPQEVGSMIDQKIEERENYEEENFMRFTLSKKDKKLREKISKGGVSLRVQDEFDVRIFDNRSLSLYLFYGLEF